MILLVIMLQGTWASVRSLDTSDSRRLPCRLQLRKHRCLLLKEPNTKCHHIHTTGPEVPLWGLCPEKTRTGQFTAPHITARSGTTRRSPLRQRVSEASAVKSTRWRPEKRAQGAGRMQPQSRCKWRWWQRPSGGSGLGRGAGGTLCVLFWVVVLQVCTAVKLPQGTFDLLQLVSYTAVCVTSVTRRVTIPKDLQIVHCSLVIIWKMLGACRVDLGMGADVQCWYYGRDAENVEWVFRRLI